MFKKILISVISPVFLIGGFIQATAVSSYNPPIKDGSIAFDAYLRNGKVLMNWTKYNKDEGFRFYKVIRSSTNPDPVYPEDSYIKYSSDVNFTSYVDSKVPQWTNYYRVCAITDANNRYCSNVVKIVNNTEPTSDVICTQQYEPVCGKKDGKLKTYSNLCYLRADGATKLYKWECQTKDLPDALRAKLDRIVNKFILKLEKKYTSNDKRVEVLDKVIQKLEALKRKKLQYKDVIDYVIQKLQDKKTDYLDAVNAIQSVFEEF